MKAKRTIVTKLLCLTALFTMLIGSTLTVSAEETAPAAAGYWYVKADNTQEWRVGEKPLIGENGLPTYIKTTDAGVLEVSGTTPNGVCVYGQWLPDRYTPEQIALLYNAIDAAGITNEMSQYDKCIAINNYICAAFTYGAAEYHLSDGLIGLQMGGIGVCNHYADLYQTMCETIGISCRIVTGRSAIDGVSHAWDAVYINGKEYFVDPTWNDCTGTNNYLMSETNWADHIMEGYDTIDESDRFMLEMMNQIPKLNRSPEDAQSHYAWSAERGWYVMTEEEIAKQAAEMEAQMNAYIEQMGGIPVNVVITGQ